MRLALARVTALLMELVPVRLRNAPAPPTPWPLMVIGSAASVMLPWMPSVAPSATVVPVLVAPSALACAATSVPALTVVAPV